MTLPAVIFTYGGDAAAVPWCVMGAQKSGLVPIVIEDVAAPLPAHVRGWLERREVRLWRSSFPRRGNLNGTDCAAGICRFLAIASAMFDGHAVKLDVDTVILRAGLFMSDPDAALVALTCPDDRPGGYGMAYRISGDAAERIADTLDAGELDPTAPEDLTIHRMAAEFGWIAERKFLAGIGPFSSLPWDADADDFARRFDVLTVGNSPELGWINREKQIANRMRELVSITARK